MGSSKAILGVAAIMLALAGAPNANATFVLGTGNLGGLGDNVIVNACAGNILGPAALVQGCLNTSHTTLVDVSSTSPGLLTANGGQARFDHSTQQVLFNNFTINFADPTLGFSGIVFNINTDNSLPSNVSFTVNAVDQFGNAEAAQVFNGTLGNGNNFFNLTSVDGEVATSVIGLSDVLNIEDIRQVRIAEADVPVCIGTGPCGGGGPGIPEPATLFLFGSAMLGYGALRRRRQRA
jgi:hypothetical protein